MDYSKILPYTHAKFFNQSDMVILMSRVDGDVQKSEILAAVDMKSPTTAFFLSLFVGCFGIDRFYLGQYIFGLIKFFTLGLFGLWWLIDLLIITSSTRAKNYQEANYQLNQYEKEQAKIQENLTGPIFEDNIQTLIKSSIPTFAMPKIAKSNRGLLRIAAYIVLFFVVLTIVSHLTKQ